MWCFWFGLGWDRINGYCIEILVVLGTVLRHARMVLAVTKGEPPSGDFFISPRLGRLRHKFKTSFHNSRKNREKIDRGSH